MRNERVFNFDMSFNLFQALTSSPYARARSVLFFQQFKNKIFGVEIEICGSKIFRDWDKKSDICQRCYLKSG